MGYKDSINGTRVAYKGDDYIAVFSLRYTQYIKAGDDIATAKKKAYESAIKYSEIDGLVAIDYFKELEIPIIKHCAGVINLFYETFINASPVVSNITTAGVGVGDGGTGDITITYDLKDNNNDSCSITVEYQGGSVGTTWTTATTTGETSGIVPGTGKSFIWRSAIDENGCSASDYKIKIIPHDGTDLGTEVLSSMFTINNQIDSDFDDLSDGLIAYYPFNGNANDESGNGHNGIVHGATLIQDRFGNENSAYSFNGGSNYYIDTGYDFSWTNTESFSISLWFNTRNIDQEQVILGKYAYEYGLSLGSIRVYDLFFAYWNPTGGAELALSYNNTLLADTWYHIAVTYDGSSKRGFMYLNEELIAEDISITSPFRDLAQNTWIGRGYFNWGSSGYFNGIIDDIRIYNRALSESEIQELYSGTPDQPDLDVDNDGDGYSENNGDCDDNNAAIHPGAEEICGDSIDNNCNDEVDEGCINSEKWQDIIDDTRLTSDSAWSLLPSTGIDSFGNIHIVWEDGRDGTTEIYYTKLDNNGNILVDDTRLQTSDTFRF